jgi:hypothetical protein
MVRRRVVFLFLFAVAGVSVPVAATPAHAVTAPSITIKEPFPASAIFDANVNGTASEALTINCGQNKNDPTLPDSQTDTVYRDGNGLDTLKFCGTDVKH